MAKSLLSRAKEFQPKKQRNNISEEEIELAIAWMQDEVTLGQVAAALGRAEYASCYVKLSMALREAYRCGLLRVKG